MGFEKAPQYRTFGLNPVCATQALLRVTPQSNGEGVLDHKGAAFDWATPAKLMHPIAAIVTQ